MVHYGLESDTRIDDQKTMSILLLGKSKCTLCGDVIRSAQRYVIFPAFGPALPQNISILNDAAVHEDCLYSKPSLLNAALNHDGFGNYISEAYPQLVHSENPDD